MQGRLAEGAGQGKEKLSNEKTWRNLYNQNVFWRQVVVFREKCLLNESGCLFLNMKHMCSGFFIRTYIYFCTNFLNFVHALFIYSIVSVILLLMNK